MPSTSNLASAAEAYADINWAPVAVQSGIRGHANVILGIMDTGISWENNAIAHADLDEDDRIILDDDNLWIGDNFRDQPNAFHGTGILSIISAEDENSGPEEEDDWGMVGVNTVSDIYLAKINDAFNVVDNETKALALAQLVAFDWDVHEMIKIKLNDDADKFTNELLICGQIVDVNSDITLIDDENIDGWNWVAYYPVDFETSAPLALTSIATSGDPDSDLYLAKGWDGSFIK